MGDAIESAVVALTMQGADAVSKQADRVTVDLSAAKRAGASAEVASRKAEKAATEAESATHSLETAAESALGKLSQAGRLSSHLFGSGLLSELGGGARVAEHAFSLLSGLLPGGGLVTSILAGGASLAAGAYVASERKDKDETRDEQQAERIAKHLDKNGQNNLDAEMLRMVGLEKIDRAVSR
jgi:hypothetical protein